MSLFQKRKPLPLDRLSESELVESDAIIEGLGVSMEMATQDPEGTRQRFREHLKKLVSREQYSVLLNYVLVALRTQSTTIRGLQSTRSKC